MSEDFNSSKNSKSVQKRKCPILSMSPILAVLFSIICIALIISYKAYSADSIGSIIAASIAVLGVYFTVMENKKKTYNEIVTRERIEWLHKMQEKLAYYLEPTSSTVATSDSNEGGKASVEDNKIANRLYYELSFNINHHKDADALKALNNYHYARNGKPDKIKVNLALMDEVKLELVLDKGEEDELLFIIKEERELDKLKNLISSDESEKIKIGKENENFDEGREFEKELALLKKDLSEEFTKIFNETWGDIKREADWGSAFFFTKTSSLRIEGKEIFFKNFLKADAFLLLDKDFIFKWVL